MEAPGTLIFKGQVETAEPPGSPVRAGALLSYSHLRFTFPTDDR